MTYLPNQDSLNQLKRTYAEKTYRTIFFLGAGASAEVGLPTWLELREGLHKKIGELIPPGSSNEDLEIFHELEELREDNDYWGYFGYAEKHWPTTYNDFIEDALDLEVDRIETPIVYKKIWAMREVRQVATLNVDGLLARAFIEESRTLSNRLIQYDGYSVTDSQAFIAKNAYCLLNLHGTIFQKSNLVMNESERRRLHQGESGAKYLAFLTWLFQTHNIVFVGINPRDMAVSNAIQLAEKTGLLGKHYWMCPTPNSDTRRWAQSNGIRLIEYTPTIAEDGTAIHTTDICSILDDLERHVSEDRAVSLPLSSEEYDPKNLEKPEQLVASLSTDRNATIKKLSGAATFIGVRDGFANYEMDEFIKTNALPIQIATSLDANTPPFNQLSDYELVDKVQSGGSSTIWLCKDKDNPDEYLIAKVLNGNRHEDSVERQSFRRGIESMYLLSDLDKQVAPKYISHLETPLVAFMEQVAGTTLKDVVESESIQSSADLLKLFNAICRAIRECHISNGHVLHRDLKPGNIIFKGWFVSYDATDLFDSEIRLINFDLSWHRYSVGNTKAISADEAGYYAPEQKGSKNSPPPRSAATDVYMLGMILFYLLAKDHPPEGGARLADWEDVVSKHVARTFREPILRRRIVGLVLSMTKIDMEDRTDIEAVLAEVANVLNYQEQNYAAVDHDFLVENILAAFDREYSWNSGKLEGRLQTIAQANFAVRYLPKGMKCEIDFSRSRDDGATRASFGERINRRLQNARQTLTDAGWDCDISGGVIKSLKATMRLSDIISRNDLATGEMEHIATHLLSSIE